MLGARDRFAPVVRPHARDARERLVALDTRKVLALDARPDGGIGREQVGRVPVAARRALLLTAVTFDERAATDEAGHSHTTLLGKPIEFDAWCHQAHVLTGRCTIVAPAFTARRMSA